MKSSRKLNHELEKSFFTTFQVIDRERHRGHPSFKYSHNVLLDGSLKFPHPYKNSTE